MAPFDVAGYYLMPRQSEDPVRNAFTPTDDQKITLYIIAGYTAAILLLWNMPIAKIILAPFKVCPSTTL